MNKLGPVPIGKPNPVRIMGILNASPESFYKKSIKKGSQLADAVLQMEEDGADFIDVGGMSTAPYLSTMVSEKVETRRLTEAIRQIQKVSNLPISVDTCRSAAAREALEHGAEILNDVSGLKYDKNMPKVVERYCPSLVLCAYSQMPIRGDYITQTRLLLKQSVAIARSAKIPKNKIAIDPAIGFFRKAGRNPFYTKIKTDWFKRDVEMLRNLSSLNMGMPILVSVSNKSFLGKILDRKNPADRLHGSLVAEAISVLNGADILRTHNVKETRDAASVAQMFSKNSRKSL